MADSKTILLRTIPHLSGHRILVVGDILLDEYLVGTAARLSREAPIPVLEFESRRIIPGGAANPAMNVAAMGSLAVQIGLVGEDEAARELVAHLQESRIDAAGIVIDPDRCTTCKTRIVSQGSLRFPQQLARLDRVDRHPPPAAIEAAVIGQIDAAAPNSDAILVSDYGNGLLTPAVVAAIKAAARRHGCLALVDSQGRLDKYRGYDIIRANHRDTARYLDTSLKTEAEFERTTGLLLGRLQSQGVVIGRGAEGVSLRGRDTPYRHFPPANRREVFDVTGAGDTSIALLALGLVAGLDLALAALLANYAAALVVQKLGNATPTPDELRAAIERWD